MRRKRSEDEYEVVLPRFEERGFGDGGRRDFQSREDFDAAFEDFASEERVGGGREREVEEGETRTRALAGIHAVREALRAGTPLRWVGLSRERKDHRLQQLADLAKRQGVAVRWESRQALDHIAGEQPHQGAIAVAEAKAVVELSDLMAGAKQPGFLLALDGIEDPHNLGAILRSACGAGVDGVILPARRSAGLSETVDRVSAGALEHVEVARVTNFVRALDELKAAGYWIAGLDEQGPRSLWEQDLTGPVVLVIGAEGRGLHELTRKRCDFLLSIPMAGGVASLNASVAAGLVLYETVRQRRGQR